MNTSKRKRDMRMATGWPVHRVRQAITKGDRASLVAFIRQRHQERYFQPIAQLRDAAGNSEGYGFAMMAICSLLIETIQSYRDGLPTTNPRELGRCRQIKRVPIAYHVPQGTIVGGERTFREFFQRFRTEFDGFSGVEFYKNIRNGLLHQAQTKKGWRLARSLPRLREKKTIDRNRFAAKLELAFENYLSELSAAGWNDAVWINARRKLYWLIRLS